MPVVGDEGEVLDVDEAVEVEVAGGPVGGGFLPVVGDDGLVLDVDDAVALASPRWARETRRELESTGWLPKVESWRMALSKRATA